MDQTKLAQLMGALRILVPAALSAGAAAGWLSSSDASTLSTSLATATPAVITIGSVLWSIFAHSKNATIAQVAAMPDVSAVVATPGVANSSTFASNDKVITNAQAAGQVQTTGVVGPSS